jgi:SAM-dependent methyltransferase
MQQNLIDHYNQQYINFTPDRLSEDLQSIKSFAMENTETLWNFFLDYQAKNPRLKEHFSSIELGCGLAYLSQLLCQHPGERSALDISELAIYFAKDFSQLEGKTIDFDVMDLTKEQEFKKQYDLVIDSHLLHCITEKHDRINYLENTKNLMTKDAVFLIETMAYQNGLQFPIGYYFDDNMVLNKELENESLAIRKILESRDIEEELIQSGFKIHYLYYHNELAFNLYPEEKDYPFEWLPRTLRIAATKI